MRVVVIGPNLSQKNQAKGSLHVHILGCADIQKSYDAHERRSIDTLYAETEKDVVVFCYDPDNFDYDPDKPDEINQYLNDIHFAPCVAELK